MSDLVNRLREEYGGDWSCVGGKFSNYYASSAGFVVSRPRPRARMRVLKIFLRSGYPSISMCDNDGKKGLHLLHRIVYSSFNGAIPEGLEIRHIDGIKENCRLDNLTTGTKEENERDKISHGTHLCGERTPSAKLSWEDVCFIRGAKGIVKQSELATSFNVSRTTIQRAQSGVTWKKQR